MICVSRGTTITATVADSFNGVNMSHLGVLIAIIAALGAGAGAAFVGSSSRSFSLSRFLVTLMSWKVLNDPVTNVVNNDASLPLFSTPQRPNFVLSRAASTWVALFIATSAGA